MSILFQISQSRGGAQASLERMATVMDTLSSTPEPEEIGRTTPPAEAPIRFTNVSFRYTDVPVIENFDLTIPYGQSVALVGASGSGKSTLSQLMLRLYDPHAGVVSIGGVDLKTCSGRDVRRMFGIVPQQPFFSALACATMCGYSSHRLRTPRCGGHWNLPTPRLSCANSPRDWPR